MKKSLNGFITELKMMGYKKSVAYMENAKNNIFAYIENWIKTGITNPRVTSFVERIMRETKRRIKKIGHGWSEHGAEKMTRLVLLRLSSAKQEWENYWKNKMGCDSQIRFTILGVTVEA